jgi:hypothetical protein
MEATCPAPGRVAFALQALQTPLRLRSVQENGKSIPGRRDGELAQNTRNLTSMNTCMQDHM